MRDPALTLAVARHGWVAGHRHHRMRCLRTKLRKCGVATALLILSAAIAVGVYWTRQAIINDDLGAFIGLATAFGRAAKRTIEADAYAFLASNPKLQSGKALFHADHGNLLAAALPGVESVDALRVKLAGQKDVGGNEVLDLAPALWLGPTKYGSAARVTNKAEYDPDAEGKLQRPNAVQGLFRDIVDTARIKDDKWYLFADPAECPVIEVAFLDGVTEPFLDYEEGFTVDGVRWKARLDFGLAALDYRGAQRCG